MIKDENIELIENNTTTSNSDVVEIVNANDLMGDSSHHLGVDLLFTDFDDKKKNKKKQRRSTTSKALSLVFAEDSGEDDDFDDAEYEPDVKRGRREKVTQQQQHQRERNYKGKYDVELERLSNDQRLMLIEAYDTCPSKTAFGHPTDPTVTMDIAERIKLDEKLVKAWFRRHKNQTPPTQRSSNNKHGKYSDVFASLTPDQVALLNAEYNKCPFILDNTGIIRGAIKCHVE